MATQQKSQASVNREANAEVLRDVLARSEHLLRRQAERHAEFSEDAEDALQSALVLFIERYRGDCDPVAWLQTTVKREAWGLRRKASRKREVSLDAPRRAVDDGSPWVEAIPSESLRPDERTIRDAEQEERERLLRDLKPDQRQALLLLGMGFSYLEIRQITGWTYTKVNRCIAEGRAELRRRAEAGA